MTKILKVYIDVLLCLHVLCNDNFHIEAYICFCEDMLIFYLRHITYTDVSEFSTVTMGERDIAETTETMVTSTIVTTVPTTGIHGYQTQ